MTDIELMNHIYTSVACISRDASTQVGAVLVTPTEKIIVSTGVNYIPFGASADKQERPAKYKWTVHAELASILYASRRGISTRGLHMYCNWAACSSCALAIGAAGITRLVRHKAEIHEERDDWIESIREGDEILKVCGVEIVELEYTAGLPILFNGRGVTV